MKLHVVAERYTLRMDSAGLAIRLLGCNLGPGMFEGPKKTQVEQCMHCGQLILEKITKYGATRCQILRLKCTKFDFRWESPPDTVRELTALLQNPICIERPTSNRRKGNGAKGRRKNGKWKKGEGWGL